MAASRRILAAGLLAALPLGVACQTVLGLDDYQKVGVLTDAGADVVVDASDGGPDVQLPDAFYKPTAWPDDRMPNPAFDSGLDANFNTVSYATISDGGTPFAVQDLTSDAGRNRTWLKVSSPDAFATEELAEGYCAARGAELGGSWRLPTRIELVALIDFTRTKPSIDPNFTLSNGIFTLWTSSPYRPYDPKQGVQYWTIDFGAGSVAPSVGPAAGTDNYSALCVAAK